jgi:hypothetical protein
MWFLFQAAAKVLVLLHLKPQRAEHQLLQMQWAGYSPLLNMVAQDSWLPTVNQKYSPDTSQTFWMTLHCQNACPFSLPSVLVDTRGVSLQRVFVVRMQTSHLATAWCASNA